MKLSVIIVNYNVRHFLEQALGSVRKAMQGIAGDVWVVDNNSVDDSVAMVQEKFPEVHLIANADNPGFAIANNQAIRQSQGEYVLLLNPDTLVEEDTFTQCVSFMDAHPECGAMGVKLIDGSGKYLPESKRGFPSPWVAFCKTFGLSAIFPKSKFFNYYYLGHLSENETNPCDVLVGAFMFMRRAALDKAGLLDEAFFMYGEDIDLSYRIVCAGYVNYYYPHTQIIHYKGESTKKGSLNYVRTFYQAMIIFARKHFTGSSAGIFVLMLQAAIWLRAGITLLQQFARRIWLPLLDALIMYGGLVILKDFWANYFYKDPYWFKPSVLWFNFPLYTLIWLTSVWLNGGYDERYDLRRLVRGLAFGTLILAAIYGFLDLDRRPSRAVLLMGAAWTMAATVGLRLIMHFSEYGNFRIGRGQIKRMLLVGSSAEVERVQHLMLIAGLQPNVVGRIAVSEKDQIALAQISQLSEVVRIYQINEVIFCSKDVRTNDILSWMTRLGPAISYKIVPEESLSIIGSSSKNEPGELYTIAIRYNITEPRQRRNKRVLDLCLCAVFLFTLPLWILFSEKWRKLIKHWLPVLLGRATWVSYAPHEAVSSLPKLKPGVFNPLDGLESIQPTEAMIGQLNVLYAKDWNVWQDFEIWWRG